MEEYRTLLEIVHDLLEKGYTTDFNLAEHFSALQGHCLNRLSPEDFEIDEIHIAEDETSPEELLLVFAVSSRKYRLKGIVLSALSSGNSKTFLERLKQLWHLILIPFT